MPFKKLEGQGTQYRLDGHNCTAHDMKHSITSAEEGKERGARLTVSHRNNDRAQEQIGKMGEKLRHWPSSSQLKAATSAADPGEGTNGYSITMDHG
jgi:hypothetical protein